MKISQSIMGLILLLALGFIWGTGYSIARFAMVSGVPPLGYSFWQSLGPALVIGLIAFSRKKSRQISVSTAKYYFVCGLTGIVIPNTFMYFAAAHLPAGLLAMIVNIVPILAYPLALFYRLEVFDWQRLIGIGFALFGLLLIILPKSSLPSPEMVPWVLSTLITPLSFAFCIIYIARFRPANSDNLELTGGMLFSSSIVLIPVVLLKHDFYFFHFPLTSADLVILLEIVLSSIGYILFFQLIKIAGPVYYSLVDTVVVLTGLFWGTILFEEQLNKWTATALCFILIALLLVTQKQRVSALKVRATNLARDHAVN